MSTAAAEPVRARDGGLTVWIDRLLPLAWVGLYLLLPVSARSGYAFDTWNDQIRDLEALRQLLDHGEALSLELDRIGPAYIGLAAAVNLVTALSPEDSLVWLTRASYALSVAGGMLLVRALVRRLTGAPPAATIAAQILFAAVAFGSWTWHWSDFPWSHFLAGGLAVAFYAARLAPASPSLLTAAGAGTALALLATTRTFELLSVVLAWLLVALLFALLGAPRIVTLGRTAAGAGAFAVTALAVHLATGKTDPFLQYSSDLDRQAGTLAPEELAETPTFSPALVPVKAVQVLVDPCFDSNCAVDDYVDNPESVFELWQMPLAVQLPALILLPACIGVLAWLVVRKRHDVPSRELRGLVEMTVAAAGITIGYLASTLSGANHLKYGFARDFMLPATLTAVVACVLLGAGGWLVLSRRSGLRIRRETAILVAGASAAVLVVVATSLLRTHGLPRIESRHLGAVAYSATCDGSTCDVALQATRPDGTRRELPHSSTLTFGCGSDEPKLTIYVTSLTSVEVPDCRDPRLVAAWPLVMGLPATPKELYAVKVRS